MDTTSAAETRATARPSPASRPAGAVLDRVDADRGRRGSPPRASSPPPCLDQLRLRLSHRACLRPPGTAPLQAELAHGQTDERASAACCGSSLSRSFLLAAYVVIASALDLATQGDTRTLTHRIGSPVASLLVMPLLGWRSRVGALLATSSVLADAAETILCATLASDHAASGWFSSQPSAGGGPTRSRPWPSPTSRAGKAAKPGTRSWPATTHTLAAMPHH